MSEPLQRRCNRCACGLTIKDALKFVSSLVLPLMLGVFTIIITIEQQRIATEQRLQDLNNSAQQRMEDHQAAAEQRTQDKEMAREQREQDERRRLQDLQIAEDKRKQDDLLAEKERDMLERQRAHELAVEEARYQKEHQKYLDALLLTYIREIGALYLEYQGNLTVNPTLATFVRLKTLAVSRQLDPSRNVQIVQYLFEAGQLTNDRTPLDLSGAHFDGIDLSGMTQHQMMHRLSLSGAYLNNALFDKLDLTYANFSYAHMSNTSFANAYIEHADFTHTILMGATFERSDIQHSIFYHTNMMYAKFLSARIIRSSFTNSFMLGISAGIQTFFSQCDFTDIRDLVGVNWTHISVSGSYFKDVTLSRAQFVGTSVSFATFTNVNLDGSDFSHCACSGTKFINVKADDMTFTHASLSGTLWQNCNLRNVDFTGSNLKNAEFRDATNLEQVRFADVTAEKITFIRATLKDSSFSCCQCNKAFFSYGQLSNVSFEKAKLKQARFSNPRIGSHLNFTEIDAPEIDFTETDVSFCSFVRSKLIDASFTWTIADLTNFTGADVTGSDFSHASLYEADITQKQLDSAMSLSATITKGKQYRNPHLLLDSGIDCNSSNLSLTGAWRIVSKQATVMLVSNQNGTSCNFVASQALVMSQTVDLTRYRRFIDKGRARACVITDVGNTSTTIHLTTKTRSLSSQNHFFCK